MSVDAPAARWFPRDSLFLRLALLVAVPLALLAVAAAINARQEYKIAQQHAHTQATALARQAALQLDEHYSDLDQFLAAVAEVARETLARGADGDPALARMIHAMPAHVTGLSILALDGRMLASTTAAPEMRANINVADRAYFKDSIAAGKLVVGEPTRFRTNDQWVSIAARPVYDEAGRVIGVVSSSARLERIGTILLPAGLPPGTLMTVFNRRGIGIASTAEPHAAIGRDYSAAETVRHVLDGGTPAELAPASDGQSRFVAYAAGQKLPWIVEVGLDPAHALAVARRHLRERLAALALALLLGLAAAALLTRWIGQPLRQIAQDAHALGQGDFTRRTLAGGYSDVNQLNRALNDMAGAVDAKQRELKASEERFRSLVMLSSDWYWTQDTEHRFTSHSAGRFGEIGLDAVDFAGKTRWEMPGAEPVDTTWEAHRALLAARKPWRDMVVRYTDHAGEVQYIASSGEPSFNESGEFTGYRGVARLVTERYRLEAQLRESEERLRATLNYSPNVAVQWYDRDGRVRFWNQASTAVFGWREDEAMGRTLDELGMYTPVQCSEFLASIRAVDQGGPRVEPAESAVLRKDGTQGVIISTLFPIPSSTGEKYFVCMDVDVTARVRLEKELRERMDLFRVTLDTVPVAIAVTRTADNIALLANRATHELLGVAPEAQNWSVLEFWADLDDARALKRRMAQDGYVRDMEAPMRTADGRRLWGLLSAQPARYLGENVTVATLNDITQRKALQAQRDAAQAALRVNEAKFRALTALSSDWYWEQDKAFRFTFVSGDDPKWVAPMIGKTGWELAGQPIGQTWDEYKALLERHETYRNAVFLRRGPDGALAYISVNGEPIFDEAGAFQGYRGTAASVTERFRLELQLRQSEAKFRALTELSSDWYWEQDPQHRFTFYSAQIVDHENRPVSFVGKARWELNMVPVGETWDEHRAMLERRETFRDKLFCYTTLTGVRRYSSSNGTPVFDESGVFKGYRGTTKEVTDKVNLENALKERMELLRVTLETTPSCIGLITQKSARMLLANRSAYETFGASPESGDWLVQGNWERQEDRRQFLDTLKHEGKVRDMEVPLVVAGRQRKWMSVSANPARYQDEDVFVVTTNDISVRRALEMQRETLLTNLRGANERLRLLSQQVLDAQEAERRKIAHELHDEIGQNLTALKLFAGHMRANVKPEAQPQLEEWITLLDQAIGQVRDLSRLLRPVQLDYMGLAAALRALLDTQARAAGWSVEFEADADLPRIDGRRETVAYRVVQEALANAARHADAASVSLALKHADGQFHLTVSDDGRGFDVAAARTRVEQGRSMGLLGMEERVRLAGGTFRIESAPSEGTRIMVSMPITTQAMTS